MANAPDCPWCGEKMRFDADSVHCWFKCDNCLAASPKALRAWDVAKSTKDNWADNEQHALRLTKEVEWHVHPPRWISVEERLPETCKETRSFYHSVTVLASENGRIMIGYFTTSKDDGSFDFSGIDSQKHFYDFAKPSHWMHLPEPPKEESTC